jgi:DNA-binding CsgD family transcriptional regulator
VRLERLRVYRSASLHVKQGICEMSAARIAVEGEAIEVSGRFSSEAEIDAFCERLWGIFFALHPEAVEEGAPALEAAPVELPQLPRPPSVMAGLDPAIHESPAQRPIVDANDARGCDAEKKAPASQPSTRDQTSAAPQAFAQLSPQERRAVMLMRKYKDRNKVAQEMEIGVGTVAVYLSTARKKGVSA